MAERRGLLRGAWLALVLALSVSFTVWGFSGSSFTPVPAMLGVLGSVFLGLGVYRRVQPWPGWKGAGALVLAQVLYLAVWIGGGLLWFGTAGDMPHFARRLDPARLEGRWSREDGKVYVLRGLRLCPEGVGTARRWQRVSAPDGPFDPCYVLMREADGGLSLLTDDIVLSLNIYRRWGWDHLETGLFDLNFVRRAPRR